ncbi:MAG: fasciclin domain-containing protein [Alphaproteobacteria bacterium]
MLFTSPTLNTPRAKTRGLTLTLATALMAFSGAAYASPVTDMDAKTAVNETPAETTEPTDVADELTLPKPEAETGYTIAESNIVETISMIGSLSDFSIALGHADLINTLVQPGPYTVLAPVNKAFKNLPQENHAEFLTDEDPASLKSKLMTHIIEGKMDAFALKKSIESSDDGMFSITTMGGEVLQASINDDGKLILTDEGGHESTIILADMKQTNGMVHVIDSILLPH